MAYLSAALLCVLSTAYCYQFLTNRETEVSINDMMTKALLNRIQRLEELVLSHPVELEGVRHELMNEIGRQSMEHAKEISALKRNFQDIITRMQKDFDLKLSDMKNKQKDDFSDMQSIYDIKAIWNTSMAQEARNDTQLESDSREKLKVSKPQTPYVPNGIVPNASVDGMNKGFLRSDRQERRNTVAFFATLSKSIEHLGTNQNILFDNVKTNIGNAYDFHSGTFRAPVCGTYTFSATVTTNGRHSSHYGFVHNNQRLTTMWVNGQENISDKNSNTIVLHLNQGDYVSIQHYDTDKTILGYGHSLMSGFLIAEDETDVIFGK